MSKFNDFLLSRNLWENWTIESLIDIGIVTESYVIKTNDINNESSAILKVLNIPVSNSTFIDTKSSQQSKLEQIEIAEKALMAFLSLRGNGYIVHIQDNINLTDNDNLYYFIIRTEPVFSLRKHLLHNKLSIADILQLGIDICNALEAYYKVSDYYGCIGPDNVFISTSYNNFKLGDNLENVLLDFIGEKKSSRILFMAPESFHENIHSKSSDIYSLGLLLHYLLLGKLPTTNFISRKEYEKALKRLAGTPISKISISGKRHLSNKLNDIINHACAYEPKNRFANITEFKNKLEYIKNGYSNFEITSLNRNNNCENLQKFNGNNYVTYTKINDLQQNSKVKRKNTKLFSLICIIGIVILLGIIVVHFNQESLNSSYSGSLNIISSSIKNEDILMNLDSAIIITFDSEFVPSDNYSSIAILESNSQIPIYKTIDGTKLIIEPMKPYEEGKQYKLIIPKNAICVINGIYSFEGISIHFSTPIKIN